MGKYYEDNNMIPLKLHLRRQVDMGRGETMLRVKVLNSTNDVVEDRTGVIEKLYESEEKFLGYPVRYLEPHSPVNIVGLRLVDDAVSDKAVGAITK